MKTLITVTNPDLKKMLFDEASLRRLASFSEIDWLTEGKKYAPEELAGVLGQYDACLTSWGSPKLSYALLQEAPRLKFIGHAAGTVVAVVEEEAMGLPITVTNANKLLARSTAEAAVAYMLAGAWQMRRYSEQLRQGVWSASSRSAVPGLTYAKVGLIGLGEISRHVIRMLKPFEPEILLHSNHCSEAEAARLGVRLAPLDELLAESDIVSLHSTWTPATEKMLGAPQLRLLKDGALLVNTARGAIIDEAALLAELTTGRFEAVLDVFEKEPLPADHPLLALPNAWCLPHIGGYHSKLKAGMGGFVIDDLRRFVSGERPEGLITRDVYKRLTPR